MPSNSLYEATKSAIEQGIVQLQEKMLKKKQLDLEHQLAHNMLHEQRLYRQEREMLQLQQIYQDNFKYNNTLLLRTAYDPYVNSLVYQPRLNDTVYLEHLENRRRQTDELEYVRRLERLKEQSMALESRATHGYRAQMRGDRLKDYSSPIMEFESRRSSPGQSRGYEQRSHMKGEIPGKKLQYDMPFEQDSSALLEKYSKGIRAQEYNRDMDRLVEIEKRYRKMGQYPSGSQSFTPQGNESIVAPYQLDNFQQASRPAVKNTQISISNSNNQRAKFEVQRTVGSKQTHEGTVSEQRAAEQQQAVLKNMRQKFQNKKIGEVMDKGKVEKVSKFQKELSQKQSALDRLDKSIKKAQNKNPMKLLQSIRPQSSKSRNTGYRQVSHSVTSAISPLKSERANNKYSYAGKPKRLQTKSTKLQNSSLTQNNNISITANKTSSHLLASDPHNEKVSDDILHHQIYQKIQDRRLSTKREFEGFQQRRQRKQVETHLHRFDNQTKVRKEIKLMINNNPKILQKHKMVVQ